MNTSGASSEDDDVSDDSVSRKVGEAAATLVREKGVDAIVLGCAGMEGMEAAVMNGVRSSEKNIKVIDCVRAAVELMIERL